MGCGGGSIRAHHHQTHQLTKPGFWSVEKMGETGGKWWKMGGNGAEWSRTGEKWGNSGHSTQDVGWGGLWRHVVEETETKMGERWEKNGTKYPFCTVPFCPFFRRSKIFFTVPFVKISSPHSPTTKWEFLQFTDTHRHGLGGGGGMGAWPIQRSPPPAPTSETFSLE